jgi:hypothetical protein
MQGERLLLLGGERDAVYLAERLRRAEEDGSVFSPSTADGDLGTGDQRARKSRAPTQVPVEADAARGLIHRSSGVAVRLDDAAEVTERERLAEAVAFPLASGERVREGCSL